MKIQLFIFLLLSSALAQAEEDMWVNSFHQLDLTPALPLLKETEAIKPSPEILKDRILLSENNEIVEPVVLSLPLEAEKSKLDFATEFAKKGFVNEFLEILEKILKTQGWSPKNPKIKITKEFLPYLNLHALGSLFEEIHTNLFIDSLKMQENPDTAFYFMKQLEVFLPQKDIRLLFQKIKHGQNLSFETDLFPGFANKMIKNFLIYRGPNCFHAALAFQSPYLIRSEFFKIKQEPGYHRSMINYDQLWRTLQKSFYELSPHSSPLKYGDILVFYKKSPDEALLKPTDFRLIRHTTTYLANGYVFEKSSKSANSPYIIRPLEKVWTFWKKNLKAIHLKIFRRSQKNVSFSPPKDLVDWVY